MGPYLFPRSYIFVSSDTISTQNFVSKMGGSISVLYRIISNSQKAVSGQKDSQDGIWVVFVLKSQWFFFLQKNKKRSELAARPKNVTDIVVHLGSDDMRKGMTAREVKEGIKV